MKCNSVPVELFLNIYTYSNGMDLSFSLIYEHLMHYLGLNVVDCGWVVAVIGWSWFGGDYEVEWMSEVGEEDKFFLLFKIL